MTSASRSQAQTPFMHPVKDDRRACLVLVTSRVRDENGDFLKALQDDNWDRMCSRVVRSCRVAVVRQ